MSAADAVVDLQGRIVAIRGMKRCTFVDLAIAGRAVQLLFDGEAAVGLHEGDLVRVAGLPMETRTGSDAIRVESCGVLARWRAGDYRRAAGAPLQSHATPAGAAALRSMSRVLSATWQSLIDAQFHPLATDAILPNYNGGASKPIAAMMGSERLGFFRITMEERLLQGLASGLGSVFQIGPIAKGGREHLFVEGYQVDGTIDSLVEVIAALVERVSGTPLALSTRSMVPSRVRTSDGALRAIRAATGLPGDAPERVSRLVDDYALKLAAATAGWVMVDRLPAATAPLYRALPGEPEVSSRARIYVDGVFVFDLGVQETDIDVVAVRLRDQRRDLRDRFGEDDPRVGDRDLLAVLATGVPPCAGFSGRLDTLAGLLIPTGGAPA